MYTVRIEKEFRTTEIIECNKLIDNLTINSVVKSALYW